jgi:taurine--2-oxoglutarate transaminase
MFATNHWDVVPDMMTIAKGLTSAYMPLGAVLMRDKVAAHFEKNVFYGGLTYNSHPMCLAAAIACIQVYEEEKLVENAASLGEVLAAELQKMKARHSSVGDVRSIGLFSIVELVKDRKTREPMAPFNARHDQMGVMNDLRKAFLDNGIYTFVRWNNFFVNPPLTITKEQLLEGLSIMDKCLNITDAAVKS